jgi:hypothetical protein
VVWWKRWSLCIRTKSGILWSFLRRIRRKGVNEFKKNETISEKMEENFYAHLTVQGYSQQKVVDYEEIFFPVVRRTSIKVVLALVAHYDMSLE